MASGEPILLIDAFSAPGAAADQAVPDIIAGASSPAEAVPVYKFLDAVINYLDVYFTLAPTYTAAADVLVGLYWSAAVASGNGRWGASIRAIPDDAEDLDTTAFTYNYITTDDAAPTSIGEVAYLVLTLTGSALDGIAAGERGILRIRREANHANDTLGAVAFLHGVSGKQA